MLKQYELDHAFSCLNKANTDEMIFILLERDEAAPATIRFWVEERIKLGKNTRDDDQIVKALACAQHMETWRGKERDLL